MQKKRNILLIIDEVQTGVGRTGKMWAYEHFDVQPDLIATAKALAGGIPIGAMISSEKVAKAFGFGDHGTTFGGNPFSCSVALEVLAIIEDEDLINRASENGLYFMSTLKNLANKYSCITEVRGMGLMIGVEFNQPTRPIADIWAKLGFSVMLQGVMPFRIVPPLTISKELIDRLVQTLELLVKEL